MNLTKLYIYSNNFVQSFDNYALWFNFDKMIQYNTNLNKWYEVIKENDKWFFRGKKYINICKYEDASPCTNEHVEDLYKKWSKK